jgi:hypothetical protein
MKAKELAEWLLQSVESGDLNKDTHVVIQDSGETYAMNLSAHAGKARLAPSLVKTRDRVFTETVELAKWILKSIGNGDIPEDAQLVIQEKGEIFKVQRLVRKGVVLLSKIL